MPTEGGVEDSPCIYRKNTCVKKVLQCIEIATKGARPIKARTPIIRNATATVMNRYINFKLFPPLIGINQDAVSSKVLTSPDV